MKQAYTYLLNKNGVSLFHNTKQQCYFLVRTIDQIIIGLCVTMYSTLRIDIQ